MWFYNNNDVSFLNSLSTDFDGVDDHITMGDVDVLTGESTATLSAWVKVPTGNPINYAIIVFKSGEFGFFTNATSQQFIFRIQTGGGQTDLNGSLNTIFDGAWHHLCGTYDGVNMKIYEDGVLINTVAKTGTISNAATDLNIGGVGATNQWASNIDEVALFDEVKTPSDLYNSGAPTNLASESGLVAWYRMGDNDTYATVTDNAGSNDGTMTNMSADDLVSETP